MDKLTDEEIINSLTMHRGIGIWTAQMLLIFNLGRPDVWPVTDLGIRRGYMIAYGLDELPCHPNYVTSVIAGSHSVALRVGIYGGQCSLSRLPASCTIAPICQSIQTEYLSRYHEFNLSGLEVINTHTAYSDALRKVSTIRNNHQSSPREFCNEQ